MIIDCAESSDQGKPAEPFGHISETGALRLLHLNSFSTIIYLTAKVLMNDVQQGS